MAVLLFRSFIYRPKFMPADVYAEHKLQIQGRTAELIELGSLIEKQQKVKIIALEFVIFGFIAIRVIRSSKRKSERGKSARQGKSWTTLHSTNLNRSAKYFGCCLYCY